MCIKFNLINFGPKRIWMSKFIIKSAWVIMTGTVRCGNIHTVHNLTAISYTSIGVRTWICNYNHVSKGCNYSFISWRHLTRGTLPLLKFWWKNHNAYWWMGIPFMNIHMNKPNITNNVYDNPWIQCPWHWMLQTKWQHHGLLMVPRSIFAAIARPIIVHNHRALVTIIHP